MKLDITSVGSPPEGMTHHHHRLRLALSLVAGLAGALGLMGLGLLILGTITPGQAAMAWAGVVVLLAVWLTGIWWRWDSPDRRDPGFERERRGF